MGNFKNKAVFLLTLLLANSVEIDLAENMTENHEVIIATQNGTAVCLHGQMVSLDDGAQFCQCRQLWTGPTCSRPLCLNGGRLVRVADRSQKKVASCHCPNFNGYYGVHCEIPNCLRGSLNEDRRTCTCHDRRRIYGDRCQYRCLHGTVVNNNQCRCTSGYYGRRCTQSYHDSTSQISVDHFSPMDFLFPALLISFILIWRATIKRRQQHQMRRAFDNMTSFNDDGDVIRAMTSSSNDVIVTSSNADDDARQRQGQSFSSRLFRMIASRLDLASSSSSSHNDVDRGEAGGRQQRGQIRGGELIFGMDMNSAREGATGDNVLPSYESLDNEPPPTYAEAMSKSVANSTDSANITDMNSVNR